MGINYPFGHGGGNGASQRPPKQSKVHARRRPKSTNNQGTGRSHHDPESMVNEQRPGHGVADWPSWQPAPVPFHRKPVSRLLGTVPANSAMPRSHAEKTWHDLILFTEEHRVETDEGWGQISERDSNLSPCPVQQFMRDSLPQVAPGEKQLSTKRRAGLWTKRRMKEPTSGSFHDPQLKNWRCDFSVVNFDNRPCPGLGLLDSWLRLADGVGGYKRFNQVNALHYSDQSVHLNKTPRFIVV